MTRKTARALAIGALALLISSKAHAGAFRITDVHYELIPNEFNPTTFIVIVPATARYSGKLDGEDKNWLIQTFLNDSIGGDLEDWSDPDWWGAGANGGEIPFSGYEVHCSGGCAAQGAVSKCDQNENPVRYQGKAGVAIYHQGILCPLWFFLVDCGGPVPEIDLAFARAKDSECSKHSVGGAIIDLPGGSLEKQLILQNNGGDDLVVTKNGQFAFSKELTDGSAYEVSVLQHPTGKRCLVDRGSGTIGGSDVTDVQVRCWNFCDCSKSIVDYPADLAAAGATNCVTAGLLDQGNGTVADPRNNLLWTKNAWGSVGPSISDNDADTICSDLVLAGRSDWRLPDVAQLQTLLPVGTCDNSVLLGCWLFEGHPGYHWSDTNVPFLTYCPPGFGCRRHVWAVALGPAEDGFGGDECWSGVGCRTPERVWWQDVTKGAQTRCVTAIRWE